MVKRLIAAGFAIAMIFCFTSCKLNDNLNDETSTTATTKVTLIYNNFKDVLPDFDFDNEPVENYEEGVRYVISVRSSKRELENYIKKIKKAGFEERAVEAEGYYCAYNSGYYVEITLVNDMLTVNIKRA